MNASVLQAACASFAALVFALVACGQEDSVARRSSSPFISSSVTSDDEPIDLAARLSELETRSNETEAQLKSLQDSVKKAETEKKKFPSIQVNGAMQVDGVAFTQDAASRDVYGQIESGADIRRARIGAKGSVSDRMDYFFQMDFGIFGRPSFTDVWTEFKDVGPLGNVRVGQWKQPFSLEVVSSYRYTTFMERAGTFLAFTPFRHVGVGLQDHSDDLNSTWACSYLRTGQDQYGGSLSTDGGNGFAGRVTHLPWYSQEGDRYLHLGLGYFLNAPPLGLLRVRSIPEIFVGEFVPDAEDRGTSGIPIPSRFAGTPFFVDTGILSRVSLVNTYGSEALWVHGPFSWQTEVMAQHIDSASINNALLWGSYSQIGYFLTGEHRPYDRKTGAIDRVIPFRSLSKKGDGWGALEVAVRWSYLDLIDRDVRGGTMDNVTFGVNWYVNPYCKMVFNYVHSNSDARQTRNGVILGNELINSTTEAYGMRCQLDF